MEYAKLTGKTLKGKPNFWQVQFREGYNMYAPFPSGVGIIVPSEEWLKSNKANFIALIDFEKGNRERPIIMGLLPIAGATSETYNVIERILVVNKELLKQLQKAKVNTQIGPQQFMPDTQQVLSDLSTELDEIEKQILKVSL